MFRGVLLYVPARPKNGLLTLIFPQKIQFYAFVKTVAQSTRKSALLTQFTRFANTCGQGCAVGSPARRVFRRWYRTHPYRQGFGKTQNAVVTARGQTQTVKGRRKNRVGLLVGHTIFTNHRRRQLAVGVDARAGIAFGHALSRLLHAFADLGRRFTRRIVAPGFRR